jgi:hypothetical protein
MSQDSGFRLHCEFLPLCARTTLDHIGRAYEWAAASDHPECCYAIWSIARLHARPPGSRNAARAVIMRHLGMIVKLFDDHLAGTLHRPGSGLSDFHCEITAAAAARQDPELQMLTYRILRARSRFDTVSYAERNKLYQEAARHLRAITRSAVARLEKTEALYAVPALSDFLSAEEKVLADALEWARSSQSRSEAHLLFEKIRRRTDELHRQKSRRALRRNRENRSYYIHGIGSIHPWCRKLARLYLREHPPGEVPQTGPRGRPADTVQDDAR